MQTRQENWKSWPLHSYSNDTTGKSECLMSAANMSGIILNEHERRDNNGTKFLDGCEERGARSEVRGTRSGLDRKPFCPSAERGKEVRTGVGMLVFKSALSSDCSRFISGRGELGHHFLVVFPCAKLKANKYKYTSLNTFPSNLV